MQRVSRSSALVLAVLTLALPRVAAAQDEAKPAPAESDIRDEAAMFSRSAVSAAKQRLAEIERTYHVPTLIETVDSLRGTPLEEAATERARKIGVPGVFVLLAKQEKKIDVIRAARFSKVLQRPELSAIRSGFVGQFAKGELDAGLANGVAAIEKALSDAKADGRVAPAAGDLVLRNQVRMTLQGARRILEGAHAKAGELNLNVNIAVVDDGGHLIAFERMDGARPASGYTATTKAITAATFRQPTGPLKPGGTPDVLLNLSLQNAAAASGGKLTTLYGGVPVVVDGQVIAGVGVGGGTGEQDATVARAGIAALLSDLGVPAGESSASEKK